MYVIPGTSNLEVMDYIYMVATRKMHPGYDETSGVNNIGLVKTSKPIAYSTQVIYLYLGVYHFPGGYPLTVFGWGTNVSYNIYIYLHICM